MADIPAPDLTPETSATLTGTEQFVMFDTVEGKRCALSDIIEFIRLVLGAMERKTVRCNTAVANEEKSGFRFKLEVPWPNMSESDYMASCVEAGTYNATYGVESATDKAILWFTSQPPSSLYLNIYRLATTTIV